MITSSKDDLKEIGSSRGIVHHASMCDETRRARRWTYWVLAAQTLFAITALMKVGASQPLSGSETFAASSKLDGPDGSSPKKRVGRNDTNSGNFRDIAEP